MCTRSQTSRRHYVCLSCRVSTKRHGAAGQNGCPRCGEELFDAGHDLEVPKKRDEAGWRALTALLRAGVTFHSRCCYGPGWRPRTPREVRERLAASRGTGLAVAEALTTQDVEELSARRRARARVPRSRADRRAA
ncbi:hypothetical protein F7Q99_22665 [Streptomyces kaniharaensis]|uniref:Deoxyxylulose-5-phosphate synthase n=1 Tax=Streptomyces kaniharaensis TaxID=212423 RepID=A0A6N7KXC2_9ACTN|nr:hypothetical protein [Streptomyces kaniharaensis]MQS14987.1 hypothetical protein [Streptomyces kaniharaensis]